MKREINIWPYILIGLLLSTAVILIAIGLTSCQKPDEVYCYECTATDYRGLPINETFCMTDTTEMQTIIDHWEARTGNDHLDLNCKLKP